MFTPLDFDSRQTLIIAILTLFLGKFLNSKVGFFRAYNLPEPVTDGIFVSLISIGLAKKPPENPPGSPC